jgi:hypothetical protein
MILKTTACALMLAAASFAFSGCADDEPRHTSVTHTESTEVHHPVSESTTVETQRVRSY